LGTSEIEYMTPAAPETSVTRHCEETASNSFH